VPAAGPIQPAAPASLATVNVNVAAPTIVLQVKQRGLFVRALWFLFIGWWLSGALMFVAGACIASVVLLPAGLALVNRLPEVMTLRPRSNALKMSATTDGSLVYTVGHAEQSNFLVRCVYFLFVGWWACMLTMAVAWFLSVLVVTLPVALMLLNRLPAITTLRKN
jgi:uncharacterized membrane protein YccF (DUF307 family)